MIPSERPDREPVLVASLLIRDFRPRFEASQLTRRFRVDEDGTVLTVGRVAHPWVVGEEEKFLAWFAILETFAAGQVFSGLDLPELRGHGGVCADFEVDGQGVPAHGWRDLLWECYVSCLDSLKRAEGKRAEWTYNVLCGRL